MSRRRTVPSMVVAVVLASGLLAPAAGAELTTTSELPSEPVDAGVHYEDPVGDVPGGVGPDIVAVTISRPEPSLVSFSVEFASDPPLTYDLATMSTDELSIGLAAEPDAKIPEDLHQVIIVHGATLPSAVETGASMYDDTRPEGQEVLEGVVDVDVDGALVTLTIERALLGDPDQLAFAVAAMTEGQDESAEGGYDVCPDEDQLPGVYTFVTEET